MNCTLNCTLQTVVLSLAMVGLGASTAQLQAAEKAVLQSRVAATEQVGFDVYLPIQHRVQFEKDLHAMHDPDSSTYQKWLTPQQFDARYGATPSQIAAIQKELGVFGLQSKVLAGHHIQVTGSATAVEQALGTVLKHGSYKNGARTIAATQPMTKPDAMNQVNAVVAGLSGTIHMQTHAHLIDQPQNRYSTAGPYWFDDLKQAYSFPSYQSYDGTGVTIGILITGDFNAPDMAAYFGHEKLATPNIKTINVDGGLAYGFPDSFETHLDVQQNGGMAPKANILVYNIPTLSDQEIMNGLSQILIDNKTDVVSMSFGGFETGYLASYNGGTDFSYLIQEEDDLFAQGNAQGITFVASSGDVGALSAPPAICFNTPAPANCGTFLPSVQFPASSPHVVGVGGTNLVTTHTSTDLNSAYVSEEAFADPLSADIFYGTTATGGYWGSGGGNSIFFKKPDFQTYARTGSAKFRTVPDVSGHMGGCPGGNVVIGLCNPEDSADILAINGHLYGVIGTSASAPDFAGLTALNIQRAGGRLGNENYYIYTLALLQSLGLPLKAFNQGIPGFNGLYYGTKKGYNRVLGNGTVNGADFLFAPYIPKAGTPQTPSNP